MPEIGSKFTAKNLMKVHGLRAHAVVQERIFSRAKGRKNRSMKSLPNSGRSMWQPRCNCAVRLANG